LWDTVSAELKALLPTEIYNTWFASLKVEALSADSFRLLAPNDFAAIWIEDNYLGLIRDKVAEQVGDRVDFEIGVAPQIEPAASSAASKGTRYGNDAGHDGDSGTGVRGYGNGGAGGSARGGRGGDLSTGGRDGGAASRRGGVRTQAFLNPRNTFENFIVGPSNQLAHAASTAVAAEPGKAYNPLFLYGDTGLGKTHLMHAVAHAIHANDPHANVVYLSCEKFTNKFLKAIRENTLDDFRRFYRKVDVLLIDDIQFLEGKERTQEEFFHTFNELYESQRQLCLCSDRPASEILRLEKRLVSRFQWGMVTDIQAPDLETRVAILKKKSLAMGHGSLPEEVLEFLATRITRNVRRMEGALIKVATYARLIHKPLDVATAERLVSDILQEEEQRTISIEMIQKKVVDYYDLRPSDMVSKRRPSNIAFPRQIAMYLCRLLTNHPLKEIGEAFGGRDHGTVIHACKTVENIMEQDPSVRRSVDYLNKQITGQSL